MGVTLPIELPITLSGDSTSMGVTLPVTLPLTFNAASGNVGNLVKLPVTLPMSFTPLQYTRWVFKVPASVTVEFANLHGELKIPLREEARPLGIKVPLKEYAMEFNGLIIEENVVAKMHKDITILEDIRSRIMFDVELVNRNLVRISWYGEEVPNIEVCHKMEVDTEWTQVGTYEWNEYPVEFTIDNNERQIKLFGGNNTGESGICTIGETMYIHIIPEVGVLVNEKIYNLGVDFKRTFRTNVNY